ncbi:MAG: accessory factor UbiK family protein [Pseudomonadota bacterium]
MINSSVLDDLAKCISAAIPPGARGLQQDIEKNVRAGLHSVFAKLNLVTREEFEVQSAVLARTREKLEALEVQVAALEARLGIRRDATPPPAGDQAPIEL